MFQCLLRPHPAPPAYFLLGMGPAAALGWPGYLLQKCVNFARKTSALVSVGIRSELRISGAVVALKIQSYRIKPESE